MARKRSDANTFAPLFASKAQEAEFMMNLIRRIVDECPRRVANSASERRAQAILEEEFQKLPLTLRYETFRYNESLYANIALHFTIGLVGSLLGRRRPLLGAALQGLAAASYAADSTRTGYILRRLLPWGESQNLLAVSPARTGEPRLRIVLLGHADAAFTGWIFNPEVIKRAMHSPLPEPLRFLDRMMEVGVRALAIGGAVDVLRGLAGRSRSSLPEDALRALLAIAPLAIAVTNLQVVLKNEVVPGANDNLTGCAVMPVLASRLLGDQPDDVELVFGVCGSEETSLGGSDALARAQAGRWSPDNTIVLAVDTLSGGDIRFVEREGEINPVRISGRVSQAIQRVTDADERFAGIHGFDMPIGGTDAQPFLRRGYDATAITCVDPEIGAPRNYHHPTDTPDNIDVDRFMESTDFIEALVRELARA